MTTPVPASRAIRPVDLYYLVGTPVFAALDHFAGISVRAAFLDGWPAARYGYYGVCFACGIASWRVPSHTRRIALAESTLNIVLLIFSIMLGYYGMVDAAAADRTLGHELGPNYAVNLAFTACTLTYSYLRAHRPGESR